jgi:hypothetical protein
MKPAKLTRTDVSTTTWLGYTDRQPSVISSEDSLLRMTSKRRFYLIE